MLVKSQVKYIQSLGQKKHRDEHGVFVAEGPKIVAELLETVRASVLDIYALPEWIASHAHLTRSLDVTALDETDLAKISQLQTPNQVLAIVKKWEASDSIDLNGNIVLALDTVQDPGNLGTIIRIADWFGVKQIVCSHECADMYNPKVVQSTMGSIARVNIIYADLPAWLMQQKKITIYAAMLDGEMLNTIKPLKEGVIVIGNESRGISREIVALVNKKITIPRKGHAESLNAAVATGIILSHLA